MNRDIDSYRDIRIVTPDDLDYVATMRRMSDLRPVRGGPRSAGEVLGGLVERCVRHWLEQFVPLQEERILTWEQRLRTGRHGRMFRELDGVWTIDAESLCLFEMKLTFTENMERGHGLKQLDIAAQTLFASKRYKYILQRLVYIAAEPIPVLADEENSAGLPTLAPNDEFEEIGVIWVKPEAVMEAATALEIDLPDNWLEPESREGTIETPDRDEWRQYITDDTKSTLDPEAEGEAAAEPDPDSPLAQALRRAMKQGPM